MHYKPHPIADVFPLLQGEAFVALKADIKANGLHHPVVLLDGMILDGRNRFRACQDVGVPVRFVDFPGGNPWRFAWSENGARRHFSSETQQYACRVKINAGSAEFERIEAATQTRANQARSEKAQGNQNAAKGQNSPATSGGDTVSRDHKTEKERLSSTAKAEAASVGRKAVEQYDYIARHAPEKVADAIDGKSPTAIIKAIKRQKVEEARDEAAVVFRALPATEQVRFIAAPVAEAARHIPPASIDIIITDPPYPLEFLPVYEDLAIAAKAILKPGASCIVMCGQSYLPDIIAAMSRHLRYHWTAAYLTPGGQAVQLWERQVNTSWKPLLWFTNGEPKLTKWVGDVAKSNHNDKTLHEWGQSLSGMLDVVERFSQPGDQVCDPFCGAGTTGAACLQLSRRFVGLDMDARITAQAAARCMAEVA